MPKIKYSYRLKKIARLAHQHSDKNGKMLDIGFNLLPNPFLKGDITGVDIVLPAKLPSNYKDMIKADICTKTPFKDNSIDVVILGGVIEHLENALKGLREINRILKPNGVLLMEEPNPYFLPVIFSDFTMNLRYYFEDTHVSIFPRRIMLKNLWHTGFDLVKIESCGVNLNDYITIPTPQQFAQDLIFVAAKRRPRNRHFEKITRMRRHNYAEKKLHKT